MIDHGFRRNIGLETVDIVSRALRVSCGAEDGPLVVLQDLEPVRDIRRMIFAGL